MNREIITISDEGEVSVPCGARMTIIEIAAFLGIFYPTAKRHIRAIEKSGVAGGDYKMACIVDGMSVRPEYYGLKMIVALAFRVNSWQADRFRRWIVERATQMTGDTYRPVGCTPHGHDAKLIYDKRETPAKAGVSRLRGGSRGCFRSLCRSIPLYVGSVQPLCFNGLRKVFRSKPTRSGGHDLAQSIEIQNLCGQWARGINPLYYYPLPSIFLANFNNAGLSVCISGYSTDM